MELPDVHVCVLFDFAYSTKDGKQVSIKEGERLYLIRKTNDDWWQVIRNIGRPFYVPATYVEEIERDPPRVRSCSVESQQTHDAHRPPPPRLRPAAPTDAEPDYANVENGYSLVRVGSLSPVANESAAPLNLSHSLEELARQIEQKAKCIADASCTREGEETRPLRYSGSFKTARERERWAKNYALVATREEPDEANGLDDRSPDNYHQRKEADSSADEVKKSERGSTDSLLEAGTSLPDESMCTTASDSLLQTSDSEECGDRESYRKRKPALHRSSRVESCRLRFPVRGVSPPVPDETQSPTRTLFGDWCEYSFSDGRTYFYNHRSGEKSWKPPRKRCNTDDQSSKHSGSTNNICSSSSSPLAEIDENNGEISPEKENSVIVLPTGWSLETDPENGYQCYINVLTGAKWFSSNDEEGRVYFFPENSNESTWTLPTNSVLSSVEKLEERISSPSDEHIYSNAPIIFRNKLLDENIKAVTENNLKIRLDKSKSMLITESKSSNDLASLRNWPQWDGHIVVLKEGTLNRAKITENGKRLKKSWTSSYVVLSELFLLFYKDSKSFAAQKLGGGRAEMSIDLAGAVIDKGDKFSSRKNVYIISTVFGHQVLIQTDCTQQAESWVNDIQAAIKNLPCGVDSCPRLAHGPGSVGDSIPESTSKKSYKVTRTKSFKTKSKDGSIEDLTVSSAERQTKIKARLKKFFNRRPTIESLVKKGIWKDEPAFGCYLSQVVGSESPKVPLFVQRCIARIEHPEENMKTDGLYRASGNLSQVQKIRLQVDQNNLSVIDDEEDVHVLTGALKLFFRELKEPLIPFQLFQKAIKASHNHNKKEKISQFREITKDLPAVNYDTLKFLLQHLLRVTKYKEFNRMHIPNIAIVFGPTLMWPEQESNNMALDLMQQNLVIECFLVEYDNIFR